MQNRLNYHHLLYFWTVVREGGVAPAARKLHVTEPTVSAQVKLLEEALGEALLRKAGRRLQPTDSGQVVLGYADEIFSLGNEMLLTIRQQYAGKAIRLHLGVVDSVSKIEVSLVLGPLFKRNEILLICREGTLADLAAQLAVHKIDAILADEPLTSAVAVKAFNTRLGTDTVTWAAAPAVAQKLRTGFPKSLDGAPVILPSEEMPMRRVVEDWLARVEVRPRIVAEVQDTALIKHLAAEGIGCAPLPSRILRMHGRDLGLEKAGIARGATTELFLCTTERKIQHPLLKMLAVPA